RRHTRFSRDWSSDVCSSDLVRKEDLTPSLWLKDIAPSHELRKWFDHDPSRWDQFREQYREELKANGEALKEIKRLEREHGEVVRSEERRVGKAGGSGGGGGA